MANMTTNNNNQHKKRSVISHLKNCTLIKPCSLSHLKEKKNRKKLYIYFTNKLLTPTSTTKQSAGSPLFTISPCPPHALDNTNIAQHTALDNTKYCTTHPSPNTFFPFFK
jgi:hypothetical protein